MSLNRWGESLSSPDNLKLKKFGLDGVSPHQDYA
jgi:hypothetical protein